MEFLKSYKDNYGDIDNDNEINIDDEICFCSFTEKRKRAYL